MRNHPVESAEQRVQITLCRALNKEYKWPCAERWTKSTKHPVQSAEQRVQITLSVEK